MLSLDGVSIRGFRSFMDDTTFHFPEVPGLYLFTGENGVGKSSFFEAICWVLFGKTSEGLRAKQIGNWQDEHLTSVVLDVRQNQRLWGITRRWNPNALTIQKGLDEPEIVEQLAVDELVAFTYDQFLGSVMFAQGGKHFMDLTSLGQAEAVSKVLNLEVWDERKKRAHSRHSDLIFELATVARDKDRLKARREEKKELHLRLFVKAEQWDKDRNERIFEEKKKKWFKKWDDNWVVANHELLLAQREVSEARDEVDAREVSLANLGIQKTCTKCGQVLPVDAKQGLRLEYEGLLEASSLKHRELTQFLIDKQDDLKGVTSSRKEFKDSWEKYRDQIEEEDVSFPEVNPFDEELERLRKECIGLKVTIADEEQKYLEFEWERDAVKFWVKEYPKIKLAKLERAALEMSVATNNALTQLGLDGWNAVMGTTKDVAGEERAMFSMVVRSPESPEWVDFRAWSGGEKTRLRNAGAAAYADLVRSRMRNPPDFEIWDEPSNFLNEEGCHSLMSFLRHRARTRKLQVWLIDHRTQYAGDVMEHWSFYKDERGTHIETS